MKRLGCKQPVEIVKQLVDFVIDGFQAVEKFKELSETEKRYSLILTDYSMPGMNGYDAAV